jgi:hypothetical protein
MDKSGVIFSPSYRYARKSAPGEKMREAAAHIHFFRCKKMALNHLL